MQLNALGLQQQQQTAAAGGQTASGETSALQAPQPTFQLTPAVAPPPFGLHFPGSSAPPFGELGPLAGPPLFMPGFPPPLGFLPGTYPPPPPPPPDFWGLPPPPPPGSGAYGDWMRGQHNPLGAEHRCPSCMRGISAATAEAMITSYKRRSDLGKHSP